MAIVAQLLRFFFGKQRSASGGMLQVSPLVRASEHDHGLALLNISSGQVFVCNRTGSRIWNALCDGRKPEEIASEISHECGVGREAAAQDTLAFVGELERRGLMIHTA